jgi:hypothetical protein
MITVSPPKQQSLVQLVVMMGLERIQGKVVVVVVEVVTVILGVIVGARMQKQNSGLSINQKITKIPKKINPIKIFSIFSIFFYRY